MAPHLLKHDLSSALIWLRRPPLTNSVLRDLLAERMTAFLAPDQTLLRTRDHIVRVLIALRLTSKIEFARSIPRIVEAHGDDPEILELLLGMTREMMERSYLRNSGLPRLVHAGILEAVDASKRGSLGASATRRLEELLHQVVPAVNAHLEYDNLAYACASLSNGISYFTWHEVKDHFARTNEETIRADPRDASRSWSKVVKWLNEWILRPVEALRDRLSATSALSDSDAFKDIFMQANLGSFSVAGDILLRTVEDGYGLSEADVRSLSDARQALRQLFDPELSKHGSACLMEEGLYQCMWSVSQLSSEFRRRMPAGIPFIQPPRTAGKIMVWLPDSYVTRVFGTLVQNFEMRATSKSYLSLEVSTGPGEDDVVLNFCSGNVVIAPRARQKAGYGGLEELRMSAPRGVDVSHYAAQSGTEYWVSIAIRGEKSDA